MSANATRKKVGEVFKVLGGGTPATANPDFWKGSIPWATSADLDDDLGITPRKAISRAAIESSATNLVPAGSVVVATRVGLGRVGIAPSDLCFSQDCQGLILDPSSCDSKFAALQLKLRVQIFKYISRGTTIAGVTKKQLLDVDFDLPPIKQQRRIVAEIEKQFTRLEAGVAALRRVQANLKRYRAAVLKAACGGQLVPTEAELSRSQPSTKNSQPAYETGEQLLKRILAERRKNWTGRGQYKEPAAPDTANLPPLPEGWTWATLEAITEALGGFAFESKKFSDSGFQVVKMANIKTGRLDLSQRPSFISEVSDEVAEKYMLRSRDILVTLTGTRKERDYGYVVEVKGQENLLLNQRIARLRPSDKVASSYLQIALQSESYRNRFFAYETGNVGQGNVGMRAVTIEPVALPPLAEQTRIVAEVERRLSVVEELESVVSANLQRAVRLRQSILQKAFTGELV